MRLPNVFEWLLELLYPTRCAFCHKLTSGREERVCKNCRQTLPYTHGISQTQKLTNIETCFSPLYYKGQVRESLLRYKFGGVNAYADVYSELITKCLKENHESCDCVTWVPLSRQRLRKRGYDQAQLIAEAVAERLGVPCGRALVKIRHTPAQSGLKRPEQRRKNVSGAYRACGTESLQGAHILLIDDIVTTGATLSECASILRHSGIGRVTAATVARGK